MFELLSNLDGWLIVGLIGALVFVLAFEFINGFHDTANAVATVIYTRAMPAHLAVILSGIFNFLGVLLGGVGVAYAIVHLLPVELLMNVNTSRSLAMIFSMLAAAITWNLGTWYFGIPASSSHTLIGSILGVGMTNALIKHIPLSNGLNWSKVSEVGLSLVLSPLVGFLVAGAIFLILKKRWPDGKMHKTPNQRRTLNDKKRPPFWNRLTLVLSAMGMSFVHGSNDGQKGIGIIMLVLMGIVPANFVLNMDSTSYQIDRTRNAASHLRELYMRNENAISNFLELKKPVSSQPLKVSSCDPALTLPMITALENDLQNIEDYAHLPLAKRISIRRYILCLDDTAKNVANLKTLSASEEADLHQLRTDLTQTTEYAPFWVIVLVALAIGSGTMIGWRRVVQTVGEKIGKQAMTYAQGMSAQITSVLSIGLANIFSLPVSTTHVLSSSVAGTMVANKTGLQNNTIRNIALAWILTLPASMILAALLFWLTTLFIGV